MLLFACIRAVPLLCASALAIIDPCSAYARVGVTSQTDGDPLGRPPTQNERVLRAGIDLQANEVVTTNANDRAHIVFLDGTSLTISPNARLVIDRFVYDPDSKNGDLAVTLGTGVLRVVGGKISKQGRITVNTPSATLGLRGGIGLFVVSPTETRAHFLFGISMAVTAGGRTEIAKRPGSLVLVPLGGLPSAPVMLSKGAIAEAMRALEGGASRNADQSADEAAKRSGFSAQNSDRGVDGLGGAAPGNGDAQQALSGATSQRFFAGSNPGNFGGGGSSSGVGGSAGGVGGSAGGIGGSVGGIPGPTGGPPRGGPPFPATPAIGVGNGGLVGAVPGGPR
jgi:hypothetical protein